MLFRNGLAAFFALLSVTFIILVAHLYSTRGAPSSDWIPPEIKHHLPPQLIPESAPATEDVNCATQIDWLDRTERLAPFNYARRDIIVQADPKAERTLLTQIDEPLFPLVQNVDLSADSSFELQHCMEPLVLKVPSFSKEPPDASNLMFGIQTNRQRLDDTIGVLLRWLPKTGARLFVILKETDEVEVEEQVMKDLEAKMRDQGLVVTLVHPSKGDKFSERYFSLVKVLYENRNDQTEWIALIDDDTFFPSMDSLLDMLAIYDPEDQHYIGSLSEHWWAVVRYGMMGFGGAGVFLSIPLAKIVDENYDRCKATTDTTAGDIRVKDCVYSSSNTKLTHIPELHQIDIAGDKSGYYESGHQPISLHHWKDWWSDEAKDFLLGKMHLVADVCGECFMQRWQFGDDTVLSNGYSIAKYPKGNLNKLDMNKMEATWEPSIPVDGSRNSGFDHSLEPSRPQLKPSEKAQFMFVEATVINGGVRQTYVLEGVDGKPDTLIDLFWKEEQNPESEPESKPDLKHEQPADNPEKNNITSSKGQHKGDAQKANMTLGSERPTKNTQGQKADLTKEEENVNESEQPPPRKDTPT